MNRNSYMILFLRRWRIGLILFLLMLLPSILFFHYYYENVRAEWVEGSLNPYYSAADSTAVAVSSQLKGLQLRKEYLENRSTINSLLNRADNLTLPSALDLINEMSDVASAISAGSPGLTVRWYSFLSAKSYGTNYYPIQLFRNGFHFESEKDEELYNSIVSMPAYNVLWAIRDVARGSNDTGMVERRLCLYTQIGNYGVPTCVLELTVPVIQYSDYTNVKMLPDSFIAYKIPNIRVSEESAWVLLNTSQNAENLLREYNEKGKIEGYYLIVSPIPDTENGKVLLALPQHYLTDWLRPHQTVFILVALAFFFLIAGLCYMIASVAVRRLEMLELRNRLEILQLQFNPHLLYNTLAALCSQIKNPVAREAAVSLSRFYRVILSNGYTFITVRQELDMIRYYLEINRFTYGLEDLQIVYDIDDDILECKIVKHLLQPIIENALGHGIRPRNKGLLHICARADGDHILFEVTDNGVGMPPKKVDELLRPPKQTDTGGYGVYNVEQRIRVYYGSQYGLKIESTEGVGTVVKLRLPQNPPESVWSLPGVSNQHLQDE